MAKSQRLRLADARAVYLLVGECRELGADPVAWQTHLLRGLLPATGAAVGAVIESDPDAGPRPPDFPMRPTSVVDCGWERAGDAARFRRLIGEGTPDRFPVLQRVSARPTSLRVFTRRDLIGDEDYYGNEYVADYIRQTNLDEFVGLFSAPAPGHFLSVGLNRWRGEPPFGARERRVLRLCSVEVVALHGTRLAPGAGPSVSRLAPRLRQVMLCLLEGDSEKQAAARLGVAPATAHEYVRRLHRLFEVSSRGQLLARCAGFLPVLRRPGQ